MIIRAKIQKWGNSLALRLSGPMKDVPQLKENMMLEIEVSPSELIVRPQNQESKLFSEAELIKDLSSEPTESAQLPQLKPEEYGDI